MIESIDEGNKEDGIRSIADKINKRLHELEQTMEGNLGRWAWELLQNAKDSVSNENGRNVCVEIELNEDNVIFKHNGSFFTELDIRGLINQISSKEVGEDEQTRNTGRFGTGFLTTHMLSKKVKIASIVKTKKGEFHNFDFLLDRDGKNTNELIPKIELTRARFQESTRPIDHDYNQKSFNTSFHYLLETDEQKEVANKGIVEFSKLIPYVLTFIPKIKEVNIIDNVFDNSMCFRNSDEIIDDILSIIKKSTDSEISDILILKASNDKVSIAIEVEDTGDSYSIKDIENIPKLFCDFPLIGSENFYFPMVVNSFFFNPLTERDGIWLKNDINDEVIENRDLLENSVELYKELINEIAENSFYDLYNLATTKIPTTEVKFFDRRWYVESIQNPLRKFLKKAKIVETNNGKVSMGEVYFPDATLAKEKCEKIWQFSLDLKVNKLPIKQHIQKWSSVIWGDCNKVDINNLVTDLKGKKNVTMLTESLGFEEPQVFDWLNECLKFIYEQKATLFNNFEIIPDQKGNLRACDKLYLDEIEDEKLKEIAELVGYDFYEELVHKNIFLEHCINKKIITDVANKITNLINEENFGEKRNSAIILLVDWFEDNEKKGKECFSRLYQNKDKLLVDTFTTEGRKDLLSMMKGRNISQVSDLIKQAGGDLGKIKESIGKAKQLDDLFEKHGVANIEELKKCIVLTSGMVPAQLKVEITQEILASLGVTTPQELEVALQDENVSDRFFHESTPNFKMFQYAQEIIKRAEKNILEFLREHPDYDCSGFEKLAPTVLGGVTKYGQTIVIVIRPSDNKQVIIYSDSEKVSLVGYENAELWIEDGKNSPRHLTLGKVLKSTGITKIPI
ncbi:sacsin N-terminal ATP-binding-like domain-containing protein [Bathymodiolus thermophilus thioautotrophic gill symbiont]|nr:hypothetical protein [Bathymodiolus thermophilus thioautotrophic gill symbiont]